VPLHIVPGASSEDAPLPGQRVSAGDILNPDSREIVAAREAAARAAAEAWGADEPHDYALTEFYCRSTDGRGHGGGKVQVQFPPLVLGELNALVASGMIPEYRTAQDVVRDAVYHRLRYLADAIGNNELVGRLNLEMRLAQITQFREQHDTSTKIVTETRQALETLRAAGDWLMVDKVLAWNEDLIELIPEPYSSQLAKLCAENRKVWRDATKGDA
jgi:hypothetical protein